jgi:hypothetical protein
VEERVDGYSEAKPVAASMNIDFISEAGVIGRAWLHTQSRNYELQLFRILKRVWQ